MKISVTQDDIDKGSRQCGYACPVAKAIMRALNTIYVFVNYRTIRINTLECGLPNGVADFIRLFDGGQPVQPFEFELGGANEQN